jgi:ElaB/YqjD/DUF883 family membrane-anchored ribosome-binding protein
MAFENTSRNESAASRVPVQFAELALHGASQWFDMQFSTARTVWQTQARAAAAFGFPDWSGLFAADGLDERMREMRATGAEQLLHSTQRAGETVAEIQRQLAQLVQTQAATAAQTWSQGLEQLGAQADESLQQLRSTAQQQTEQLGNATRAIGERAQASLREGGERLRAQTQEAGQRSREALAQAGDQAVKAVEENKAKRA